MDTLLHILVGTWFVCSTNFPMWTKGHKTNPAFTYGLITQKNGSSVLSDKVSYLKKGKPRTIHGYDYPDKKNDSSFVWRGKGLLRIAKSKWRIVLMDPAQQWAVIYFSKTMFTPGGIDIISRQTSLSKETINGIKLQLMKDQYLAAQVNSLKNLYQL